MEPSRTGVVAVPEVPDMTGRRTGGVVAGALGVRLRLAALLFLLWACLEQPAFGRR